MTSTTLKRTGYSAAELMAADFPEPRFAIPGIVPEGLTFFAGAPKLGKSWLALNLAVAVSAGGKALGSLPVERGEVLYLSLEDPPRRLKQRLSMLLGFEAPPQGLHFETQWERTTDGGADRLQAWLKDHPECRLVIIDVFARIRPRVPEKVDRYTADYEAAAPIKALADQYGVAALILHHTRKASAEDFLESVSGTNGLAGAADTITVLRRARGRADAELHVTGRDVEEQRLALKFSPLIGSWTLLGSAEEYSMGETRRRVIQLLRMHGPLSPKGLADLSSVPHETAKKTMSRMAADGQLKAEGGRYSLTGAVPPVPLSLPSLPFLVNDDDEGTQGRGGHGDIGGVS